MGIELFGGQYALFFAIACFTAYFFSGEGGIYSAQKVASPKIAVNETDKKYMRRMFSKYKL
jgi:hypothetical protein